MDRLWREGTIGVTIKDEKRAKIVHYWAKVYEEGSEYGINEGRISKLEVKVDGKTIIRYDRGWDIEPEEDDEVAKIALAIILNSYS